MGASPLPTSDRSLTMSKIKKDLHRRLKHTSHTAEQVVAVNELDCDTGSRSLAVHGRLNMRTSDSEALGIKKKRKRKKRKQNVHEDPTPSATGDSVLSSTCSISDGEPLKNTLCSSEKRDLAKLKVWSLLN